MAGIGVEQGSYVGVPVPEGLARPDLEARFRFRELSDDRIEVHHPFHGPVILGDASAIRDPSIDAAAVVLFKEMPYLVDSMKLNRIRRFETRPFAGEYAQLSHCFSLGLLAVEFGGGPMDILDGLYNDASHTRSGHQDDDNYQGHGQETLHDNERARFFERAGIIEKLIEAGAFRRNSTGVYVGKTRIAIDQLLSEEEVTVRRSFLSNKHPSRRLDGDRFQYNEEERFLMHWAANMGKSEPGRLPRALAELSMESIARLIVPENDEGEQLAFTNEQAALQAAQDYVRHNAEHWNEPVQDLVNDLLNLADRYFFVCDHPHAQNFQLFYPRDYLHTSASYMYEQLNIVAQDDPVMAWFLQTAEAIAADQRPKAVSYYNGKANYQGPNPPEGVTLQPLHEAERRETAFWMADEAFVMQLPHGKKRTIDPRILYGNGKSKPLSEVRPEFLDFATHSNRWVGDYEGRVRIEDPALRAEIQKALDRVRDEWPRLLASRPPMPPPELRRNIKDANDYVRKHGSIPAQV